MELGFRLQYCPSFRVCQINPKRLAPHPPTTLSPHHANSHPFHPHPYPHPHPHPSVSPPPHTTTTVAISTQGVDYPAGYSAARVLFLWNMLSTKFEGCSPPSEILLSDANPESVLGLLSTGVWLSAAMFGNLLYLLAPLLATECLMA